MRVEHSQLTVITTESDHSALLGEVQLDRNKLLLGIHTGGREGQGRLANELRARLAEEGLGGTISTLAPTVTDSEKDILRRLARRDTVIVEGPMVLTLLPCMDLLFHVTGCPPHGQETQGCKVLSVSDVGAMLVCSASEIFEK